MNSFRTCILLFLGMFISSTQGQPGFEKVYNASWTLTLVETPGRNLLGGLCHFRGVSLLDQTGNIIHTKEYGLDSLLALRALRRYAPNEYYFVTGYNKDSCSYGPVGKIHPLIGRMDSMGNMTDLRYYDFNADCYYTTQGLEVTANRSIITWGPFFALMADSSGTLIWAKDFDSIGAVAFVKELPGGDLLMGMNMDTAGAVVARMDPLGNFIWCKSYIRPKGIVYDCVIESDNVFVVTGLTDSIASSSSDPLPPDYHPKLFMMQLNGAGMVQWCKGYDSDPNPWYCSQRSHIERTLDGQYLVMANLGAANANYSYRPFLMKTDQNGDTLWTRTTGTNGYSYQTYNVVCSSDGGFLYSGVVYGDLPWNSNSDPFIFKTDSLGLLPCLNRWHSIEVSDLFPTDSSLTPTWVDGATMHQAFVTDTVLPPIAVYDGCDVLSGTYPMPMRKFRVRPNPTAGRVTVEFDDPLMAESYYSVYDTMGKLLHQRPLPTGATTEQIDLSRFGQGTYVVKLTDPVGVRYEQVVVE